MSWMQEVVDREKMAQRAAEILDFEILEFLRLPNLRTQNLPLLDIVKKLIPIIENYK